MIESQAACSHPHLIEVDGLYAYYRCPACGDYFHIIQTMRHTPRDLAAMAHWFTQALVTGGLPPYQQGTAGVYPPTKTTDAPGDGDSNGVPRRGD